MNKTTLKYYTSKKAFTLVEVLVSIAILSILFILLITKIEFSTDKTKISGVQTDFRSYQSAFKAVGMEHQGFTTDIDKLSEQINRNLDPKLKTYIDNHALKTDAKDPWGTTYQLMYKYPANSRGAVEIRSAGKDLLHYSTDDIVTIVIYKLIDSGSEILIENFGSGNNGNTATDNSIIAETGGMYSSDGSRVLYTWDEMIKKGIIDSTGKVIPGQENKIMGVLSLPQGMTALPIEAYKGCNNLTGIIIPDTMTTLAGGTFWGCTNLKEVVIPESVTFVGNYTFRDCTSLESVDFPDNVTYLNPHVMEGCSNVKSVSIPNGVTVLDCSVFKGNTSLTTINLPSSIEVIWQYAFLNCSSLRTINYPGTISQWNSLTFGSSWYEGTTDLVVVCQDGSVSVS